MWSCSSSLPTAYSRYWAPFSPALPKTGGAFVSSRSYRIRPYVVNYSGKSPDAPSTVCTEWDVKVHGFYTSYFPSLTGTNEYHMFISTHYSEISIFKVKSCYCKAKHSQVYPLELGLALLLCYKFFSHPVFCWMLFSLIHWTHRSSTGQHELQLSLQPLFLPLCVQSVLLHLFTILSNWYNNTGY